MCQQKYRGIQALRGIAACMVVTSHALTLRNTSFGVPLWENGAAGVDVFFVVSGFVMAIGRHTSATSFVKRRVFRVVPLYWVFTFIMLGKLLAVSLHPSMGIFAEHVKTPLSYIVASLLFIPYRNSLGIVEPILIVGWTLSFEMFFYLLFAVGLLLKVNMGRFLSIALITLATIAIFRTPNWPAIAMLLDPILLEFLAGALLGLAVKSGFKVNLPLSGALGIIGVAGICTLRVPSFFGGRPLTWGIFAFLIVQAGVMLETKIRIPEFILSIGDASYSLYLSHMLVLSIFARMIIMMGLRLSVLAYIALQLIASTAAAFAVYRLIELPMNNAVRTMQPRSARLHGSLSSV